MTEEACPDTSVLANATHVYIKADIATDVEQLYLGFTFTSTTTIQGVEYKVFTK